jgi:uncharacterized membrane protein
MPLSTFVREPNPDRIVGTIGAIMVIILTVTTVDWLKAHIAFLSYVLGVAGIASILWLMTAFYSTVSQGFKFFTRLRLARGEEEMH